MSEVSPCPTCDSTPEPIIKVVRVTGITAINISCCGIKTRWYSKFCMEACIEEWNSIVEEIYQHV